MIVSFAIKSCWSKVLLPGYYQVLLLVRYVLYRCKCCEWERFRTHFMRENFCQVNVYGWSIKLAIQIFGTHSKSPSSSFTLLGFSRRIRCMTQVLLKVSSLSKGSLSSPLFGLKIFFHLGSSYFTISLPNICSGSCSGSLESTWGQFVF